MFAIVSGYCRVFLCAGGHPPGRVRLSAQAHRGGGTARPAAQGAHRADGAVRAAADGRAGAGGEAAAPPLFPEGCWVTSVYGDGEIPAEKQALRCRVSRRSTLYLSEEKLFESENDVPEGCRAGMERCVPGEGDPFPAVAAACREASWQGFVQPERRLFRPSELAHPPVEPASPLRLIALYRERLPHVTTRRLYALYLASRGCADDVPPDSPEWLLDHFESAEKLLDFLASELQHPEERADESVSIAAYLRQHFQEDVSLDSVSHALSMSVKQRPPHASARDRRDLPAGARRAAHGARQRAAEGKDAEHQRGRLRLRLPRRALLPPCLQKTLRSHAVGISHPRRREIAPLHNAKQSAYSCSFLPPCE